VTVLAGSAVLLVDAPGHAAADPRPDVYDGAAVASVLHVQADREPQLFPVTDPLHAEIPYATTALDSSGGATASAASLYPGAGALGLRGLLCTFDSRACLPLPDYPLMATASYPTAPDAQAQPSQPPVAGPIGVTPGLTVAHADPNRVEARAQAAGLDVAGVVSVESAATHSKQAFEGGTLVVTAESTLQGLDIGGGALHVDALRSVSVSRVDGRQVTTTSATTTLTGATAGGTPVTVDSTGVHVAGNGDDGVATSNANAVLAALQAAGIDVRLAVPTRSTKDGVAAASTGGLLVSFRRPVDLPTVPLPLPPGVPAVTYNGDYYGTVGVGGAGVIAFASPGSDDGSWVPLPPPVVDTPTPPSVAPAVSPGLPAIGNPQPGDNHVGSGPQLAGPRLAGRPLAVLGVDLSHERLKTLALVLVGYPALVLLLSPLRARPRRRPSFR
jgi:hypothetical protein